MHYLSYLDSEILYFSYQKSLLNTLVWMTDLYTLPDVDLILLTQDHINQADIND